MGYLLDTHTLLWFLDDNPRLSLSSRELIEKKESIFIANISLFEITIKVNIGKLAFSSTISEIVRQWEEFRPYFKK